MAYAEHDDRMWMEGVPAGSSGGTTPQGGSGGMSPRLLQRKIAMERARAKAIQDAKERKLRESLQGKMVRNHAIGRPAPNLLPVHELGIMGFDINPNSQGIPYGIAAESVTDEEAMYLKALAERLRDEGM